MFLVYIWINREKSYTARLLSQLQEIEREMRGFSTHYPVLWRSVLELAQSLDQSKPLLLADCTVGGAGHSAHLLSSLPTSYLLGTDVDKEVLALAETRLQPFSGRYLLKQESYTNIGTLPRFPGVLPPGQRFSLVLIDLGLSSYQLDTPERGFSYQHSGPLDMRFNRSDPLSATAGQIINNGSELELRELFKRFGEEPMYREAADVIMRYRSTRKVETTKELADVLNYAFFSAKSLNRFQSISRCFQALRMAVNGELRNIETFFASIFPHIEVGGLLVAISFHSLEDTLVKANLERWMGEGLVELRNRQFKGPSEEEIRENSRSAAGRLRYCVKVKDVAKYKRNR